MAEQIRKPFFHGGTPGLVKGDLLTPHPELAHSTPVELEWTLRVDPQRNDFVFFTEHFPWALLYAHWYSIRHRGPHGAVYEVRPIGPVEADTSERTTVDRASLELGEDIPALAFRSRSAEVVRVAAWSDGSYWFDAIGQPICRCSR